MSELITAARPYARAVFEMAQSEKTLAKWSEALAQITSICEISDMQMALENPGLTKQQKAELLIEAAGDTLDQPAQNLLRTMAENDRLVLLAEVTTLFEQMRAEAEGSIEAELISAYEVSEAQQKTIAESLKKRLGRDVKLDMKIDKDLLGGVIIKAGDLVIDGSIRGRLEQLTNTLSR